MFMFLLLISDSLNPLNLPDDLSVLCPFTQFCNVTRTKQTPRKEQEPCCRPCSCAADCGRTRNCCTHSMDTYQLESGNQSSCISIGQQKRRWYYMIDRCPGDNVDCREIDAGLQGGVYPHSSLGDGFIYINKACSECNDAKDIVPWRLGLFCEKEAVTPDLDVEDIVRGNRSNCIFDFLPPDDVNVKSEMCYPESNIVRECDTRGSDEQRTETLRSKCLSFNATYITFNGGIEYYANVYCAACRYMYEDIRKLCPFLHDEEKAPPGSVLLLLDSIAQYIGTAKKPLPLLCKQVK